MILVQTKNFVEGFHEWSKAPKKVLFLRNQHRHIFDITCQFEVTDEDREIELIMQQWEIEKYLYNKYGNPCQFGGMSCEMIAKELLEKFDAHLVQVLEDGAGGAIVRR